MEQHDALGVQPEMQLADLALAAIEPLALLERPRADEGVGAGFPLNRR
jgi:hypothetical protein